MKKYFLSMLSLAILILLSPIFSSCQKVDLSDLDGDDEEKVTVLVDCSGFSFSYENSERSTRASDKTAAEADVTRIAVSIFNASGNVVLTKNMLASEENFGEFSCQLLPGDYSFVAVAHKTLVDSETPATINSLTSATITTAKLLSTYSTKQDVTIVADQTNNVSITFGQRVNSTFRIETTDDTPEEVYSCEIVLNPSGTATSAYTFNPSTGLSGTSYQNKVTFLRADQNNNTFKRVALTAHCFLTHASENITVVVNMKDVNGNIVKTRTFSNVSMAQHRVTYASGMFFHAGVESSLLFDTTTDTQLDIAY